MTFIDYRLHFHHPANNLVRGDLWGDQSENEFGNRFADAFGRSFGNNVITIRELPVPGTGIADFVVIRKGNIKGTNRAETKIQAFEFKLKNWRGGLMQAHRYKFFSNSAILVIPAEKIRLAQKSLNLFKQLGVGLWGFNSSSGAVTKKFTPRHRKVRDLKRSAYVMEKALEARGHC